MRYRALDANKDYAFGRGLDGFLIDSPAAVGQAAFTRLMLYLGEWFLDTSDGTPWDTQILGHGTQGTRDIAIKLRVLGTQGVVQTGKAIENYSSSYDSGTRAWSAGMTVNTIYGQVPLSIPQ